jgi:SAM-dependent methyltransferase
VACRSCPKFAAHRGVCAVPFGSPLRKCVTAAQEAHLHSLEGQALLEIGFGKHSIPRQLVTAAGGSWTGIDPLGSAADAPRVGSACRGDVGSIPFPDATFDMVTGIQTLEHWSDPLPDGGPPPGYARGLAEVHRVLKPGGSIYFDAPIHLHGHEMFIAGDIERIRSLFDPVHWTDLTLESWRRDYAPLARYPTPTPDQAWWNKSVTTYPDEQLDAIVREGSVWLLTVTASKR